MQIGLKILGLAWIFMQFSCAFASDGSSALSSPQSTNPLVLSTPQKSSSPFSGQVGFYSLGTADGSQTTIAEPEVLATITYTRDPFYFYVTGFNIDWLQQTADPAYTQGGSVEMDLAAGISKQWQSGWSNDIGFIFYYYPGTPNQIFGQVAIPPVGVVSANTFVLQDTIAWQWLSLHFEFTPMQQFYGISDTTWSSQFIALLTVPIGQWLKPFPNLFFSAAWDSLYYTGTDALNIAYNNTFYPGAPYNTTPTNQQLFGIQSFQFGLSYHLPDKFIVGVNYQYAYSYNILGYGSTDQCLTPGYCGPYPVNTARPLATVYLTKDF